MQIAKHAPSIDNTVCSSFVQFIDFKGYFFCGLMFAYCLVVVIFFLVRVAYRLFKGIKNEKVYHGRYSVFVSRKPS